MATLDLGKIKQVWRGTYNNSTAYTVDDLVEYTDSNITSTYICVANSTGNAPSSSGTAHASWNYVAKGVADPIPSQSGNAGKVLKSDGTNVSWGSGFEGTHYLAYSNTYQHGNQVTVNGSGLSDGTADGQRDCIVINHNNYHTFTPTHVDDIIVMGININCFSDWTSTGSYWGIGFMTATSTNFANNRNVFFRSGQHCFGNGGAGGDMYMNHQFTLLRDISDIGLSINTTYYLRPIGLVHTPNQNVSFNAQNGSGQHHRHNCFMQHFKRNA